MSYTHLITREPPFILLPSPSRAHMLKMWNRNSSNPGHKVPRGVRTQTLVSFFSSPPDDSSVCYTVFVSLYLSNVFMFLQSVSFLFVFYTCFLFCFLICFSFPLWFVYAFLHWSYLEASLIVLTWNVSVGFSESSPPVNLSSMIWLNKLSPSKHKL